MSHADQLIRKATERNILFGVVGLGYVGLPLAYELVRAGYRVLGYDINERVVNGLMSGKSHIKDISDAQLAEMLKDKRSSRPRTRSDSRSPTRSRSACRRRCPSSRTPT
jgi:UDP-N-acetyl-D-mannosaminuronate dehydrogenase